MKCLIALLSLVHFALGIKEFLMSDFTANWHEAHEFCTTQGMQLVTVDSRPNHDALVAFIKRSDRFQPQHNTRYWIGASDLAKEGRFTWISSGLPVGFTKWAAGEPNKAFAGENCVEIIHSIEFSRIWVWNDMTCQSKAYFVCESIQKQCIDYFK